MSESSHAPIHLNISSDVPSASRMRPRHTNKWQASHVLGDSGSGIADLYDVVDAIGSMTINDVDELEANLIMDLARARRDIFNAEKTLADCVVPRIQENTVFLTTQCHTIFTTHSHPAIRLLWGTIKKCRCWEKFTVSSVPLWVTVENVDVCGEIYCELCAAVGRCGKLWEMSMSVEKIGVY
ncbi:hypothetical protein DFJ58DRAFT_848932 [Suillus subalutaceus]|uniref:uncharacterized protein n=1 Tax=Suillus subalutaceus TaxID=48586 RepID=UPI001B85F3B7|nr:uncharacterized protein DFJ58DRAFT_848932 [Suillus subalutaceus]KAG1828761.1 hypothetical protein DFJ58DRAFT_848932 [Suillus subalutaceus]